VLPQVILLVVAISLALSSTVFAMPAQQAVTGTLRPLAGLVQIQAPGQVAWNNVAAETAIQPGSQIRTSNDGFASLTISNNNTMLIYPTSQVEFSGFLGTEGASNIYAVTQYVGTMHVSSNAAGGPDRVSVVTPAAGLVIRGTEYLSFVGNKVSAGLVVLEGTVNARTATQSLTANPNSALYINLTIPRSQGLLCSEQYLGQNTSTAGVITTITNQTQLEAVKAFLEDSLVASVHPAWQTFMRSFFGLPALDFGTITPAQEAEAFQELVQTIRSATSIDFAALVAAYRAFVGDFEQNLSQNPLAPATCGNGVQDAGETVDNCGADFANATNRGNGLCEISRPGVRESLINAQDDCGQTNFSFVQSCTRTLFDLLLPRPPRPTRTPVPTSTPRGTL
jgi:hypothetical protein